MLIMAEYLQHKPPTEDILLPKEEQLLQEARDMLFQDVRNKLELLLPDAMNGIGFSIFSECYDLWDKSNDQIDAETSVIYTVAAGSALRVTLAHFSSDATENTVAGVANGGLFVHRIA